MTDGPGNDDDGWDELPRAPLLSRQTFNQVTDALMLQSYWNSMPSGVVSSGSKDLTRHMVYNALGFEPQPDRSTPGIENNGDHSIRITSDEMIERLKGYYRRMLDMPVEQIERLLNSDRSGAEYAQDTIAANLHNLQQRDAQRLLGMQWAAVGGELHGHGELTQQQLFSALEIDPAQSPELAEGVSTPQPAALVIRNRELAGELAYFLEARLRNPDDELMTEAGVNNQQLHRALEAVNRMTKHRDAPGPALRLALPLLFALLPHADLLAATPAGKPSHCLALFDDCKYPKDFKHFEYVNPSAPQGGSVKLAENGTFDNLNPFILKGVKAPGITDLFESLMVASLDEPQAMYGLVAESVTLAADNSSAEFTLRKEARWHDGSPITPDDVVFSFTTLKEKGDPTFKILYGAIGGCNKTGERTVRFTFTDPKNRELPLMAAQMPIISKAYYSTHDFEKTTLDVPMGSGPYTVDKLEQGRFIVYKRVENHWSRSLPAMVGQYNFATIRYDMYRDENVALEAFKSGEYDFRREYIARNWATAYDSPAIKNGSIIKREIPDNTPQGMQAFIFNTRRAAFADARVREAIDLSLDYEWVNKTIFYGAYVRNASFFENTDFQAKGAPTGRELELLKPFEKELPPALFTREYANAKTDGSGNPRDNLLLAQKLLEDAGWSIQGGKRVNAKGEKLTIEFLLRQPTMERVIGPMRKNLERLGIASSIRIVDDSQYQKRTDEADFDVVSIWINRGVFFPGNEQAALWHSSQAGVKGGNNLGGIQSKVVDHLLEVLTKAKNRDELLAAGRALDRVLLWNRYVIPNWHSGVFRVAYKNRFGLPAVLPRYSLGFQTWWVKQGIGD